MSYETVFIVVPCKDPSKTYSPIPKNRDLNYSFPHIIFIPLQLSINFLI